MDLSNCPWQKDAHSKEAILTMRLSVSLALSFYLSIHVSVSVGVGIYTRVQVPTEARGIGCPWNRNNGQLWVAWHYCCELNLGPLQEQSVLLTHELSSQPWKALLLILPCDFLLVHFIFSMPCSCPWCSWLSWLLAFLDLCFVMRWVYSGREDSVCVKRNFGNEWHV